jgi:ferredoxin
MTLLTEEQRNKLSESGIKAPHVNETCIGCSACVAIASEVFELNEEGLSVVLASDSYNEDDVNNSIAACPVDAISWK